MSNALGTMKSIRAFSTSNVLEGLTHRRSLNGALTIEAMPVFKSGTFKDSMGFQNTWEPEHLEQMVFNFGMLKNRGILPNVPVRDGHRSLFSGGEVIGYITDLRHDQDSGRLLADFEVTEPEAAAKIERGTFRARSAEIGMYETNDEAVYWPVFMGFAFVDIPAVEGLYSRVADAAADGSFVILTENDKESTVKPGTAQHAAGSTEGEPNAAPGQTDPTPSTPGPGSTPEGGAAPAGEAASREGTATAPPAEGTATGNEGGSGGAEGTAEHAAPTGTFTFSVNGQPTTDFTAVQAHITRLETVMSEQRDSGRRSYVSQLAADKKITQPQVESLTKVALGMNDEQFADFRAAYEAAPTHPTLAAHAGAATPSAEATNTESDEIANLRETVAMHRRSGIPEDQIAKMPSAIRLKALTEGTNPKE